MKWADLTAQQKIRLIIKEVLHWECFESWQAYQRKYGDREWAMGAGQSFTTPTHVAFLDTSDGRWSVFTPDHEDLLSPFDPLHRIEHAWLIVELERWNGVEVRLRNFEGLDEQKSYSCLIDEGDRRGYSIAKTAQEAICLTALMMSGIDIEP